MDTLDGMPKELPSGSPRLSGHGMPYQRIKMKVLRAESALDWGYHRVCRLPYSVPAAHPEAGRFNTTAANGLLVIDDVGTG